MYVVIRDNIFVEDNYIIPVVVVCHYGDMNDTFLIGGLVLHNETLVACAFRRCNQLARIYFSRHERIYLYKVFDGTIKKEPAKICMFTMDAMNCFLKNNVGGISFRNLMHVPRGNNARAGREERASKWQALKGDLHALR